MFHSGSKQRNDSTEDLLSGWTLGDSGQESEGPDSLFPHAQDFGQVVVGSSQSVCSRLGRRRGSDPDSQLYQVFEFEGEEGDDSRGVDWGATGGMEPLGLSPPASVETGPKPGVPVNLPNPGETLGGFRLVSELGRGAFARVYLAEQSDLGGRLVALKVSRAEGNEPQILARLQHTHIVPIFSVHDDPETHLRLICMPYLGGANLARVLDAAGTHLPDQACGRSLVEALDLVSHRAPLRTGPSGSRVPSGLSHPLAHLAGLDGGAAAENSSPGPAGKLRSLWRSLSFLSRGPALAQQSEPRRAAQAPDVSERLRRVPVPAEHDERAGRPPGRGPRAGRAGDQWGCNSARAASGDATPGSGA